MQTHTEILAKSNLNNGISLHDHLQHVSYIADIYSRKLGYNSDICKYGAIFHDIGKAHPVFQNRLKGIYDNNQIDFRHEISSIFFIPLVEKNLHDNIIDMVIAHHRSPIKDVREQGIIDLINLEGNEEVFIRHSEPWEEWMPIALDILESLNVKVRKINLAEAKDFFCYTIEHCKNKRQGWSEYKGIMIGADHLASAVNERSLSISERIFEIPDLGYFHSENRKSTIYPLSLVNTDNNKKHTLVIAPTGAGKTDFLMKRCKGRIFYTLPFQASINAMYERLKNCLPKDSDIRLLHASSRMLLNNNSSYEEKALQAKIGASVKVLTPHQLAGLICGTRGFESMAIDIKACDVILDEIHSYSKVAQSMVIEIIKVLLKLKCRIHIGSATMPTVLTEEIKKILGGSELIFDVHLENKILDTFNRHKVFKHKNDFFIEDIVEKAIKKNDKILVVCNRVTSAQQKYIQIKKTFPDIPIMLIHSRFKRIDRNNLEKKLIEYYANRDVMPDSCIIIATQVVEVSLDISFDVMITEAAPIDSLIQRFGRINRYRNEKFIKEKIIKDIHVLAPAENKKDCLPYDKDIIDLSFGELPDSEILNEKDIQRIIDKVYPKIEIIPIGTHLVWEGDHFLLKELCHFPKSVLLETLNIESACCILQSDQEMYVKGNSEIRTALEIPVSRSVIFQKNTKYGISKYGNHPIIIDDTMYDSNLGLVWKEIENFL
ncbi:MAG: CRISPR-associated helicase Cas3' [Calditrichaceae bacterium]|nr:CRISPR-associated helicase Cas3' [Calditrichaceae bacterium]MBN2708723.1 CRISPR-associated helicase Cas3' [Calditrichaceae bacterium]RQV92154.1 MAG: CRISPR-associated helicase Cas3' [Calditrichota bacterium]